jgi:hypothetical protein
VRIRVRTILLRNGSRIQSTPFEVLTLTRVKQKYAKVARSLPSQFTFRIESDDKRLIWIAWGKSRLADRSLAQQPAVPNLN